MASRWRLAAAARASRRLRLLILSCAKPIAPLKLVDTRADMVPGMEFRHLGESGLKVSEVIYGTG